MSVGLLIIFKGEDTEDVYYPIATESVYSRYWKYAGQKLDLKWVVAFQTGITVRKQYYLNVLEEYNILAEYLIKNPDKRYSSDIIQMMQEKIDVLRYWLNQVMDDDDAEVFIG